MISCHLFVGINLLVLMLCGIFLIRVVMLRSSWLTAMVIKTSIERQVIPNQTLRGFDKIDSIKEELEKIFFVLILFLLPLEMALCWSVLDPESLYVFSLVRCFVNLKGPFTKGFKRVKLTLKNSSFYWSSLM